jgi:hypothetical protein
MENLLKSSEGTGRVDPRLLAISYRVLYRRT